MMTEQNYAILWLNMSKEWIPKSEDSNWINMSFNPENIQQVKTRRTEFWAWVLEKAWKIYTKVLQQSLIGNGVWKWCEIEQWGSEEISEVGQNRKTEETAWQP